MVNATGAITFYLPNPVMLPQQSGPRAYSVADYHTEHVWGHSAWRESAEAAECLFALQERLLPAFERHAKALEEDDKARTQVTVSKREWEFYFPIVTLRGVNLPQPLSLPLTSMMRPMLLAQPKTQAQPKDGEVTPFKKANRR